jgi:hypothetical protein
VVKIGGRRVGKRGEMRVIQGTEPVSFSPIKREISYPVKELLIPLYLDFKSTALPVRTSPPYY